MATNSKLLRGVVPPVCTPFTADYEVDEKSLKPENEDDQKTKITKAIEIIHNRIDSFGVSEPIIRAVGSNRIEIQMPGLNTKDDPGVLDAIKKPARLDFRVVNPSVSPGPGVEIPAGYEILTLEDEGRNGEIFTEELFVRRIPEMSGDKISRSSARPDLYGKPEVVMNLGHVSLVCALGYLDFRFSDIDWRSGHPALAGWFAALAQRPSYQATLPGE